MVAFSKLRLSGFKSFVDKTELDINGGLTGIVGPNGCGKSNLVEALRWVMGESSAKRMRGDGMEDVIFSGTAERPARNFAEVSLLLDNSDRGAPDPYESLPEIEITRRIERDQGSQYKINGKTCRARDVQMLFADTVTGAHSPALVSQGRVTAIINAKPQERRLILEESAGISGIYARRHEAELRLRAADKNLQRLEDLVGSMEGRLNALKKQSRQAHKYKNLSAQIRQLEIAIAYLEWRGLYSKIEDSKGAFADYESVVAERTATVAQLAKTETTQQDELPAIRKSESECAATLQTQKIALQRIEDQEQGIENQISELTRQIEQLGKDRAHEAQILEESAQTLTRLEEEEAKIRQDQSGEDKTLQERQQAKDTLEEKVLALESEYAVFMEKNADTKARKQALEQQISAEQSRLLVAGERREDSQRRLEEARADFGENIEQESLKSEIVRLEKETEELRDQVKKDKQDIEEKREYLISENKKRQNLLGEKSKTETEIKTLEDFLNVKDEESFHPVLQDIEPEEGYEIALSRALGDALAGSTDTEAPVVWLNVAADADAADAQDLPALPAGSNPLAPHIQGPDVIHRALSQIGLVADIEQGMALRGRLKPGQALVSKCGAYWRWDGLHIKPSARDRHAIYLQQQNRHKELTQKLPALLDAHQKSQDAFDAAKKEQEALEAELEQAQERLRGAEQKLAGCQAQLSRLTEERSELFAEIAKLEESLALTDGEIESATGSLGRHKQALAAYDEKSLADQSQEVENVRLSLSEAQHALREAVRLLDQAAQEQSRRKARLHAIADEAVNMKNRAARSRERLGDLDTRETELKGKLTALQNAPKTFGQDRQTLLDKISELQAVRDKEADRLAVAEGELEQTRKALKQAEHSLSEAREQRASAEATVQAGQEQLTEIDRAIAEKFDMSPQELGTHVTFDIQAEDLPDLEDLRGQKEKLVRSRDLIGPVNLRAESEAEQLEQEVGGILHERNDLVEAIEELRGGIQKLNREARERLMLAFEKVNTHFQTLFTRLFAGGKAHLALVESDDPLESGLEIFAQPPGKTLQSLSLLSGGEQTLASIALIFAMFLTNPSPICVLDEIDAPLDDVNVDRVCELLEEMAQYGQTRFLVITHHRLTMARMDRLYGVTMAERGISQLVSVDMNQQFDFLEEAA